MAAGVAYTQALFASVEHPVMLNIGIAVIRITHWETYFNR